MWLTQAARQSERSNSVYRHRSFSTRRDIVKKGGAEYLRAALAHAEQYICTNQKYQVDLVSDIDQLKKQVSAERVVSKGRLVELLQLKRERLIMSQNELDQSK